MAATIWRFPWRPARSSYSTCSGPPQTIRDSCFWKRATPWSDSPPARARAWIGWIGIWAQYPCRCPSIDSPFESPLGVPERDRALLVFIRVYLRFSGANIIAQAVTLCHCLRTAWRHFQIVAHGGSKFRHLAVLTADPRKWDQRNPKSACGKRGALGSDFSRDTLLMETTAKRNTAFRPRRKG